MCRKAHIIRRSRHHWQSQHHLPQANIIQKKNLCLGRQRFFFCWWRRGKSKRTRVPGMIFQYFSRKIGDFTRFFFIFLYFLDRNFYLIFVPTSAIFAYKLTTSEANARFCLRWFINCATLSLFSMTVASIGSFPPSRRCRQSVIFTLSLSMTI